MFCMAETSQWVQSRVCSYHILHSVGRMVTAAVVVENNEGIIPCLPGNASASAMSSQEDIRGPCISIAGNRTRRSGITDAVAGRVYV